MKLRKIVTDSTHKELFEYEDETFQVDRFTDRYIELYNRMLDIHHHYEVEYTLVLKGTLSFSINGCEYTLRAGDCAFVNSNTLHMAKSTDLAVPAETFVLLFPISFLSSDMSGTVYRKYIHPISGKGIEGSIIKPDIPSGQKITETLHDIQALDKHVAGYELLCTSLLFQLWKFTIDYFQIVTPIHFTSQHEYRSSDIAKAMLLYIHTHYAEQLTVPSIAEAICVSTSECFRCFKLFTHRTPIEYINDYRLKCAEKMLIDTTCNITEVGHDCGFCSSSYFSKQFKEKHNLSPRQFRQKYT